MDTDYAVNAVVSSVKKSNLNFYIQESPFSLSINLRKTFIKNKKGTILYPIPSNASTDNTIEQKQKIVKLEEENRNLSDTVGQLIAELSETRDALHGSNNKLENANKEVVNLQKEKENLVKKINELQVAIDSIKDERKDANKIMKAKDKDIAKLVAKNNTLEEKVKHLECENSILKDKLALKNYEMIGLEDKMKSLLDILYGCHECGLCECECSGSITGDCDTSLPPECATTSEPSSPSPPSHASETAAVQHLPQPTWTPPPTPPCSSCGGPNFGPCPSSVCFGCIPPWQPEPDTSSPSRTPPGTPPLLRRDHRAVRSGPDVCLE